MSEASTVSDPAPETGPISSLRAAAASQPAHDVLMRVGGWAAIVLSVVHILDEALRGRAFPEYGWPSPMLSLALGLGFGFLLAECGRRGQREGAILALAFSAVLVVFTDSPAMIGGFLGILGAALALGRQYYAKKRT